jgi:hypothetical protein
MRLTTFSSYVNDQIHERSENPGAQSTFVQKQSLVNIGGKNCKTIFLYFYLQLNLQIKFKSCKNLN